MEGVLILHEALNSIHSKKQNAMLFMVDFEKAYDKVKWPFVLQTLKIKGFPDKWIDWIMHTIRGGKVGIKINDNIGPFSPPIKD